MIHLGKLLLLLVPGHEVLDEDSLPLVEDVLPSPLSFLGIPYFEVLEVLVLLDKPVFLELYLLLLSLVSCLSRNMCVDRLFKLLFSSLVVDL